MTKSEQTRLMAWRLKILRQAAAEGNVARVCRRYGISRQTFYKWKRRHAQHGDAAPREVGAEHAFSFLSRCGREVVAGVDHAVNEPGWAQSSEPPSWVAIVG